jgi:hypothetical protein
VKFGSEICGGSLHNGGCRGRLGHEAVVYSTISYKRILRNKIGLGALSGFACECANLIREAGAERLETPRPKKIVCLKRHRGTCEGRAEKTVVSSK